MTCRSSYEMAWVALGFPMAHHVARVSRATSPAKKRGRRRPHLASCGCERLQNTAWSPHTIFLARPDLLLLSEAPGSNSKSLFDCPSSRGSVVSPVSFWQQRARKLLAVSRHHGASLGHLPISRPRHMAGLRPELDAEPSFQEHRWLWRPPSATASSWHGRTATAAIGAGCWLLSLPNCCWALVALFSHDGLCGWRCTANQSVEAPNTGVFLLQPQKFQCPQPPEKLPAKSVGACLF